MTKLGLIGWRGMVGSVLVNRMKEEGDFEKVNSHFFSTSNAGSSVSILDGESSILLDAYDISELIKMDIIITCQGSDHAKQVFPQLQQAGWQGYWIDASSAFRMEEYSRIALDPVNNDQLVEALAQGVKVFCGGNCSITLALVALAGLLKTGNVDWMSVMTFQAASGAGAANVRELISQNNHLSQSLEPALLDPSSSVLDLSNAVHKILTDSDLPLSAFDIPLAGNLIPWIDTDLGNGTSREEYKGEVEANKILGLSPTTIRVDGICTRVGAIRSHATAITLKLKQPMDSSAIQTLIENDHEYVQFVKNDKTSTLAQLTPLAVQDSLKVAIGRLKPLALDDSNTMFSLMTVGDQLLWGAAEPLRRMLNIILAKQDN